MNIRDYWISKLQEVRKQSSATGRLVESLLINDSKVSREVLTEIAKLNYKQFKLQEETEHDRLERLVKAYSYIADEIEKSKSMWHTNVLDYKKKDIEKKLLNYGQDYKEYQNWLNNTSEGKEKQLKVEKEIHRLQDEIVKRRKEEYQERRIAAKFKNAWEERNKLKNDIFDLKTEFENEKNNNKERRRLEDISKEIRDKSAKIKQLNLNNELEKTKTHIDELEKKINELEKNIEELKKPKVEEKPTNEELGFFKKILNKLEELFSSIGLKNIWKKIKVIVDSRTKIAIIASITIISIAFGVYIKIKYGYSIGKSILAVIISVIALGTITTGIFALHKFFSDVYKLIVHLIEIIRNKFRKNTTVQGEQQ